MLKWSRRDLLWLNRKTRAVLRGLKCHHYNASLERLYLPRSEGGRGLKDLAELWEGEVVAKAVYLVNSSDDQLKGVVRHQLERAGRGCSSLISTANSILNRYELQVEIGQAGVLTGAGDRVAPKLLANRLKVAQRDVFVSRLEAKTIHSVFFKQCQEEGWDTSLSHQWLKDGRLQARTESLIVAAQDGVIHTRAFRHSVLKIPNLSPKCRLCGRADETLGHVLLSCDTLKWTLYKERHDKVLYQVVLALARKFNIILPERLKWGISG